MNMQRRSQVLKFWYNEQIQLQESSALTN
jgi:hypothetical protein